MLKIFLIAASLTACGVDSSSNASRQMSIIDQDTLSAVDASSPIGARLQEKLGAIGKMTGGCTAFHLGEGVVATAGHCLAAEQQDSCQNLVIDWGFTGETRGGERSRCLKTLQHRLDDGADFALLLVDPIPAAALKMQARSDQDVQEKARALVIGFPQNKLLSWSGYCEAKWNLQGESKLFYHGCDTLPGHSGSPVLDAENLNVIGLHDGEANGQENYGSFLPASEEIRDALMKHEEPASGGSDLHFGPFADKLHQTLVNFTRKQGEFVSFNLSYDVEDGYDKLLIVDGTGRIYEMSGKHQQSYQRLPTPVSLAVKTDYAGNSNAVAISAIGFN